MPQPHRQRDDQKEILVALGGNITSGSGTPAELVRDAVGEIGRRIGPVTGKSRVWRTPAFPAGSGPDYANAACRVASALPPHEILAALHRIEAEAGRERSVRWGARTLDLDLLAVGARVLPDAAEQTAWRLLSAADQRSTAPAELILPHPRLQERGFVLVPLAEVAPDWRHPLTGLSVRAMCDALPPEEIAAIRPWDEARPA